MGCEERGTKEMNNENPKIEDTLLILFLFALAGGHSTLR